MQALSPLKLNCSYSWNEESFQCFPLLFDAPEPYWIQIIPTSYNIWDCRFRYIEWDIYSLHYLYNICVYTLWWWWFVLTAIKGLFYFWIYYGEYFQSIRILIKHLSNIICVSQKVYFEYKIVEIKLFVGVGKYILKVKHYLCES